MMSSFDRTVQEILDSSASHISLDTSSEIVVSEPVIPIIPEAKLTYTTNEKFEIIEICFKAVTKPAKKSSIKYSDFYPIYFAFTPPAAWLNIAWIGRRLHSLQERDTYVNPLHVNPLSLPDVKLEQPIGNKRRKLTNEKSKKNQKKEIQEISFIEGDLDISSNVSAKALKSVCDQHKIPFLNSINHQRVKLVKEIIELYYLAKPTEKPLDLLEMLQVGLGYTVNPLINLKEIQDNISMATVGTLGEFSLIRAYKNSFYPPFYVYFDEELNTLFIEISTFYLSYYFDIEHHVLSVTFQLHQKMKNQALTKAPALIPTSCGLEIKPEDSFIIKISLPPDYDPNSLLVDTNNKYCLLVTLRKKSKNSNNINYNFLGTPVQIE